MKLRPEIALVIALAIICSALAIYRSTHPLLAERVDPGPPVTLAERIDAMTEPYGADCAITKQSVCYKWLLTATGADGQQRSWGYFHSKPECEQIIPQIWAEQHATNGGCVSLRLWGSQADWSKSNGQVSCMYYPPNPGVKIPENCLPR